MEENPISSGRNFLRSAWNVTKGTLAVAAVSTAIAAATGGLSLTATGAMAAGDSIALSGTDLLLNVGQGFAHNLSGLASGITSILPTPAPV